MFDKLRQFNWQSSRDRASGFTVAILCVLIVIFNTPILARNMPNIVLIGLMVAFVASVIPRLWYIQKGEQITLLLLALYMVAISVYKILGISSAELYYYFNIVQYYFFFGAILMIYEALTPRQMKLLLAVALGTVAITMISNVYLCATASSPNEYVNLYKTHRYTSNATNTQFATAVMILIGASFAGAMSQRNRYTKWGLFGLCILSFLFAAMVAQRLIVVILTILMIGLLILAEFQRKEEKQFVTKSKILGGVVLLIVLIVCLNYKPILQAISELIGSPRVSKRINQIIVLLETGDFSAAGGSLGTRYELMMTSWNTFTNSIGNFFLGVGDHRASNELIGNHSLILDEFARYGVIISGLSFALVARSFLHVRDIAGVEKRSRTDKRLLAIFAVLILRAFVGALFDAAVGIELFIVLPLMMRYQQEKTKV